MRLDKFLKVSRIIKRRSVANEACSLDRVTVNGKSARPSKEIVAGDIVGVRFGDKNVSFRILEVPSGNVAKDVADHLYEVLAE
jgi:ribosomal 50S subunit-recycling heat shock protein